ncbi:hypothetical protein AGABI1DRAFT_81985 [Agaricus bisporus var. burnettii JB137-S8]|uniref:Ribosomal eL28/Mak16 domain-containing protein n=2 Tax=Agaricus bisporus var. burnettii TaxID=192524 RepID=K5WBL4_AGABU|nr:uncharacterized protein AGABI1DRAFT_81985 [Agaricus bisporus var. burnettii JB137-S8]EKM84299.1 hypothetical protein AGABI1DRAFT_81985 [Agaricus bisporus var. burnettii JB137-S8]KAF7783928.1 hypothetical protein Agabi119p4_93 [Agaricus bisporus var. burnettii]
MSADLQWLLLRKNNSHIVKRGPIFSKEPGNLRNIHSFKYSGFANAKTIDVSDSNGAIRITTRKVNASPHAVAAAATVAPIRARSGGRRALGVGASVAKRGYRPDLRAAVLARISALMATQKEPKASPPRKTRGKKSKAAESS